jgi:hypothetical protein
MDVAINNILWMNIHVVMWLLYAASAFFCMNDEVDEIPQDAVMVYFKFNLEQFDTISLMCSLGRKYKRASYLSDLDVLYSSNKTRKLVMYDHERANKCVMSDWLCKVPRFPDKHFERVFRLKRHLVNFIVNNLAKYDPFWT